MISFIKKAACPLAGFFLLNDMDKVLEKLKGHNVSIKILEKREWLGVL